MSQEEVIQISNKRKVTVGYWRNQLFVNLREYYKTQTGEMKPSTKGVGLNLMQWNKLYQCHDLISSAFGNNNENQSNSIANINKRKEFQAGSQDILQNSKKKRFNEK
ncbi:activated RNA polymerase ii transcriptional coactivator p15 [Anaeramoeba flamelloides]|uniref:Activated RNA polymerase ii transcriptional coactivator p15 n=1 Tax=Anaeramoeba flamelloides TaxID=1746091 RepID=A0AAV8A0P7_9EUKA|nr:activated RNA polymerase ii transcriptional coactivator p15 [Anaeramoeba flamelloides]